MDQSILRLGSSMQFIQKQMDIVSNNVANANTSSFKKDKMIAKSFYDILSDEMEEVLSDGAIDEADELLLYDPGVFVDKTTTDFTQGALEPTGDDRDFALEGEGFFVLENDEETFYSRGGAFRLNQEGYLIDSNGYRLIGELNEPVYLSSNNFIVDQDGNVFDQGLLVNKLSLASFENLDALDKLGNGLYKNDVEDNLINSDAKVLQGYKEASNVNMIEEMTAMMKMSRLYETNQKTIQVIDGINQKSSSELGRVF